MHVSTSINEQEEPLCDFWDEERVAPKSHSRLYNLEPIGVGTPLVESLTSYTSRLAMEHSITVRKLVSREIMPLLSKPLFVHLRQNEGSLSSFWGKAPALNGFSESTIEWVRALEQLTLCSNLRFLTMLTWVDTLSPKGFIRRNKAWCPLCYQQWQSSKLVLYDPLLWSLEAVTICPQHGQYLQNRCPHIDCQRRMTWLASQARPGYCAYCGTWLGELPELETGSASTRDEAELAWQKWIGEAVGEFLNVAPTLSSPPRKETFGAMIASYIEQFTEGNETAFARQLGFHRESITCWQQGTQVPQLGTLLRLCFALGASPCRLLLGQESINATRSLNDVAIPILQEKPGKSSKPVDEQHLQHALEMELAREQGEPSSLEEIAKRFDINRTTMRKHFPAFCQAIAARYKAHQSVKAAQNRQQMIDDVRQATYRVHSQGVYPSTVKVQALLRMPSTLRLPYVNAAWHQTLQELRWEPVPHPFPPESITEDAEKIHRQAAKTNQLAADTLPQTASGKLASTEWPDTQQVYLASAHQQISIGTSPTLKDTVPKEPRWHTVEPIGIGTPGVESLTGYLARCAEMHQMSPKELIMGELLPRCERLFLLGRVGWHDHSLFWEKASRLNSTNPAISDWVNGLEVLVHSQNLRYLTMMAWEEVLVQTALIRRIRAWCPKCYEEWRSSGQAIYEPLLWALQVVQVCPRHHLLLRARCHYDDCQRQIPLLGPTSRPGYCSACGRWLGASVQAALTTDEVLKDKDWQWHQWVVHSVGELLAAAPSLSRLPQKENTSRAVSTLVKQLTGGNVSELARQVGIPTQTLFFWQEGHLVQLRVLLQFCYQLGNLPLPILKEGTVIADKSRLKPLKLHKVFLKPYLPFDVEGVRQILERALMEEARPPLSVQEIANRLDYDLSTLYRRFPELCRALTKRHRASLC